MELLKQENQVIVHGFAYCVHLGSDPEGLHMVSKTKVCSCGQRDCQAIRVVHEYLKAGGQRAPDPLLCPICGGMTFEDRRWTDTINGIKGFGWRCEKGGIRHWMQDKTARIQRQLAGNPWLFEPVYDENGACIYAGVRRDEVMTFEQCQAINQRIYHETGYNPNT
jgi:hypothetical protein